ncbi:MAG: DNA-binding protein [Acidobacteria bacterium]|nr:MAG: DNA-binding protein [Acidobacteriota bacterium]
MPPDIEVVAEARAWFSRAAQDLRAADFEMTAVPPLTADVAFHAQQAAEKAMKGLLTLHSVVFRKTHSLVELGQACASVEPDLEPLLIEAAPLTEYAWRYRYPGEPDEPLVDEAMAALTTAHRVYESLLRVLPEAVRP